MKAKMAQPIVRTACEGVAEAIQTPNSDTPYSHAGVDLDAEPVMFTVPADGGITLYIQNASPGASEEANWLPSSSGPFFAAMRLYWPKPDALDGKSKAPASVPANRVQERRSSCKPNSCSTVQYWR